MERRASSKQITVCGTTRNAVCDSLALIVFMPYVISLQSGEEPFPYLNGVVAEIRWAERLSELNHVPHFPYFVTYYVDSIPIASIGGILCDVLFNPKYAGCVYKVTVAIDSLGNIVWICPLAPGGCSHLGSRRAEKEQGALYGL